MATSFSEKFADKTVLTFDVYGTLIDWETGIFNALHPILSKRGFDCTEEEAFEVFFVHESTLEAGPYLTYREILVETLNRICKDLGFEPTAAEVDAFSNSVGDWPAFPDSQQVLAVLKKRFKLAVITNCDDELFALSNKRLGVDFDYVITSQQARSYKPSLNNFHVAFGRILEPREQILHVAESMFHDHVPAKELDMATIWINRRHGKTSLGSLPVAYSKFDAEFPDMMTFAAAIV